MADTAEPAPPARPGLEPGQRVEVRTGFDRSWAVGFEVIEITDIGYRLRRLSDASVLPVVFPFDDVRRERKNSMWWF